MTKYIYKNKNGRYEIRKKIGGILIYWGSFTTLEEAKLYRAYYMGKNWKASPVFKVTRYLRKQYDSWLIIKKIDGEQRYFGRFSTLEDAISERDLCVRCNWDFNDIVEFGG